jgi:hypothetical protein
MHEVSKRSGVQQATIVVRMLCLHRGRSGRIREEKNRNVSNVCG